MYHYRKTYKRYKNIPKTQECPFCLPAEQADRVNNQGQYSLIIENIVAYDLWEGLPVLEHLLLIPKRHVKNLGDLTELEAAEIMKIVSQYQTRGYNIYSRSYKSLMGSVEHQHTHLIKTDNTKRAKALFFINNPRFLKKY